MATAKLRFVNRVVLVTGAGNGLGKAYALAFGARGAKVVVNDLGGDVKGGGQSSRPADLVAEEICSKGGTAIANYDSVEEGEKIVNAALDNFGRIDAIVNNAGILRDRSFARVSDTDWDVIQRIHVRAAFVITRAAWPHMKKQKHGRIINISSVAGIYGNFGQANYSTAKMGVVGLMNTLAVEGKKDNIFVNAVAPTALSRMTKTIAVNSMMDPMQPELVAPLVLWLCHEDCNVTGQLFECGGGWMARLRWQRAPGVMLRKQNIEMTPEDVRDNWEKITDFTDATYPTSISEANAEWWPTVLALEKKDVEPQPASSVTTSWEKVIGATFPEQTFSYTERDAVLYALGVGVSTQHDDHLKFLFEGNAKFAVLPTYAVIPAVSAILKLLLSGNVHGFHFNPAMMLHGEQYTELHKPLDAKDTLISSARVADILDKGSGAVLICNSDLRNMKGESVAFNQTSIFIQQAGGFGGRRTTDKSFMPVDAPKRAPDVSVCEKTSIDQAALYRLSGDRNPLHIDPSFAAIGGFSSPILHGLCSFGYAGRHVLKHFCDNDVSKFKAIKVRFSSAVLPGQTLQTDMWKEKSRVFIQCSVVETGKPCLTGAYVDLNDDLPLNADDSSRQAATALHSDAVFTVMNERVKSKPVMQKTINAIYLFDITVGGKNAAYWTVDVRKDSSAAVYRGQPQNGVKPDCTLTISDGDFVDLAAGKLSGTKAFTSGHLKVAGNMMLAMRLQSLFSNKSKL